MRRLITISLMCAMLAMAFSCVGRKDNDDAFSSITRMVDSAMVQHADVADIPKEVEEPVTVEPVDELFDDFLVSFATSPRMQLRRVTFPLHYVTPEDTFLIEKRDWSHDWLFFHQEFYTLLFDHEEQMDLEGDTSLTRATVEWVYLNTLMLKKYDFERQNGVWMLNGISMNHVDVTDDGDSFLQFYQRFATDSIFQLAHVANPIQFVTIDPDDDFSILETTLGVSQWSAFRPELPAQLLSNIDYGQENHSGSNTKILKINGVDSGLSILLYFRKRAKGWEMYRFEDTST